MRPPRLLDLCSGAGLGAIGYARAGFEIVGVDIHPQPNYPFEFHQADAIEYGYAHGRDFDAVHASFPCQSHTALTSGTNQGRTYVDLIPGGRPMLDSLGVPYVIENVQGAPLRRDVVLCGEMFGLEVIRHRYFELGRWSTARPVHLPHRGRVAGWRHGQYFDGPYFAVYGDGGGKGTVADWQRAMGVTHTSVRKEIAEGIPPAYGEWIGTRLLSHLMIEKAA